MLFLCFVYHRNHDTLQRLTHLDVHLTAQSQYHRSNILCHLHTGFQFRIDQAFVGYRELGKVYRNHLVASGHANQVHIQTVGIERSNRCHQFGYGLQASVECLISRQLIGRHGTAPETFTVQTHVPVTQVIVYKVGNQTSGLGRFVIRKASIHVLDQRVQQRQNPAVDFRTLVHRHVFLRVGKAIHVGIQGKE